ncbi:hypothetical protein PENSPDRAFT_273111 [Peniophora sp. CONT]|nr:hypothetical protein PENSPDRAFT_273111 [Peniophora sp. CONT]
MRLARALRLTQRAYSTLASSLLMNSPPVPHIGCGWSPRRSSKRLAAGEGTYGARDLLLVPSLFLLAGSRDGWDNQPRVGALYASRGSCGCFDAPRSDRERVHDGLCCPRSGDESRRKLRLEADSASGIGAGR